MDLLVDPLILAVPPSSVSDQELDDFISNLSQWKDEFRAETHNFMMSESCAFALDDTKCFPYLDRLQELWPKINDFDLSYIDIYRACIKVLSNTPFLEDRIPELRDIEVYEESVTARPDLVEQQPEGLKPAFQKTLGCVTYAQCEIPESIAESLYLLTYPIGGTKAEIWATVLTELPDQTDYTELRLHSDVMLIDSLERLQECMDFKEFWEDTDRAIHWRAQQMNCKHLLSPFKVHSSFNESIKNKNVQNNAGLLDRIFRQCVLLLSKNWAAIETHNLGRPQHVINDWKSYRLYITEGAPGWRLHYWRRGNEFYLVQINEHDIDDIDVPIELHNKNMGPLA